MCCFNLFSEFSALTIMVGKRKLTRAANDKAIREQARNLGKSHAQAIKSIISGIGSTKKRKRGFTVIDLASREGRYCWKFWFARF